MDSQRVLIGVVGCYPFVRAYPLGPELMQRLKAAPWLRDIVIREMNWSPIAIVQELQAGAVSYDRVVLIGKSARGRMPGSVSCRYWLGGVLEPQAVQQRMFEAVTGVISIDNLLVIGEQFGVWPDEVITVEAELPEHLFGDIVLAEAGHTTGRTGIVGEQPLTAENEKVVDRLIELSRRAARQGVRGLARISPLTVSDLKPVAQVCYAQFQEQVI